MEIVNCLQGSVDWHQHRRNHFNASDAPAMMGESPYKTRSELLHELHTGVSPEVTAATQRRFDDGHRYEALARPLGEEIIDDDLYPVVGSDGKLSASFDGLTMDESTGFEHKSLNDELRSVMTPDCTGADLPMHYQIQMEQQCMVSAAQRILFMASKWDGDELVEERHCWYTANPVLADKIRAGWAQFSSDLTEYAPVEYAEKPVADTIMQLPALAVQIRGEVVVSNLPAFKDAAIKFIETIKTDLETDEDFSNAEATVKFCESAEKNLELTKSAALGQTASIDELMKTIDFIQAELRTKRLTLTKLVATKKTTIKENAMIAARDAYAKHIESLDLEVKPIRIVCAQPDFAGAAKNKRTLASLHDAINTELANAKIAADAVAKGIRSKLAWCKENADGYGFLFMDMQQLVAKADEDFQLVVTTRIAEHKKAEAEKLEAQRVEIQKQEEEKARAVVAAEQEPVQAAPIVPAEQAASSEMRPRSTPIGYTGRQSTLPTTAPTLRLGHIADRLGFAVTADFLQSIGFEPAGRERSSVLFHESDFDRICVALIGHINSVRQQQLEVA
ncbi:YqaJ viral recombinase family protein [Eoetvoesiella caeni]|uniref:Putative phage-type endonuclease n=1 Tax=Eoetvoesiella caeni TaxID=645616 RepID=A0A366HCN3_9BURK|nr:YqaJ viral recombinase family protein [Eoetvoesiella caeni]MCI2809349.1 YqaJ viral recombinase family protein [Eoetvoesiella caeni]NYT54490.1 YqaJ viral recombinase family protein [Eoetvoesiella caeni]RBP39322.1 putative phage-type endonuclease [Eoetvoesiella caeni]